MSLDLLNEITQQLDVIIDRLGPGIVGFLEPITSRIDKIEGDLYSGAGGGIIINSAQIAEILESTNFISGTSGWRIVKSGNAEFQDVTVRGTIYATAGEITGTLYVGTAPNRIIINGPGHTLQSEDYSAGIFGWQIAGTGAAEFQSIVVRGAIDTAVFHAKQNTAIDGSFLIAQGAGTMYTTPSGTTITAGSGNLIVTKNDIDGTDYDIANVGDILRLKDGTNDTWLSVDSKLDLGSYFSYNCTYESGSLATYYDGQTVVNYGASGDGGILMTAEATNAPYIQIFNHAGSPWSAITEWVRLGNLNGWGGFSSDTYGLGLGDYSGGNYFYIDDTGAAQLAAGNDLVRINTSGIILRDGNSAGNKITWLNGWSGDPVMDIFSYNIGGQIVTYSAGTSALSIKAYETAAPEGQGAVHLSSIDYVGSPDYTINRVRLFAGFTDNSDGIEFEISDYETGSPFTNEITVKFDNTEVWNLRAAGLLLENGTRVDEFSTDGTMAGNSDLAVPTEKAVKTYVDAAVQTSTSTFTPTVTQTVAVASTPNYCKYVIIGKTCHMEIRLQITGSGTSGGQITIGNLPAACAPDNASSGLAVLGNGIVLEAGVKNHTGTAVYASSSSIVLRDHDTGSVIGTNPAFGIASGDFISINLNYLVA